MYSDLALYYLQQMGIRPWIKRNNIEKKAKESNQKTCKLLVFVAADLSVKGQTILHQMITFLDVSHQDLITFSLAKGEELTPYSDQVLQQNPSVVLVLGSFPPAMNGICSVIQSLDPDYLVAHPVEKRKAFTALQQVKRLLI